MTAGDPDHRAGVELLAARSFARNIDEGMDPHVATRHDD
jgi:hypothetical protein